MNHSRTQSLLSPYLEGDLSPTERTRVESHVGACSECSAELRGLRATVALLRALPAPEPPPYLASRVSARIADGEGRAGLWSRWLSQAGTAWIAAPLAA